MHENEKAKGGGSGVWLILDGGEEEKKHNPTGASVQMRKKIRKAMSINSWCLILKSLGNLRNLTHFPCTKQFQMNIFCSDGQWQQMERIFKGFACANNRVVTRFSTHVRLRGPCSPARIPNPRFVCRYVSQLEMARSFSATQAKKRLQFLQV